MTVFGYRTTPRWCGRSAVPTDPVETFICVKLQQLASNLTTPQTARLCGSVAVILHYCSSVLLVIGYNQSRILNSGPTGPAVDPVVIPATVYYVFNRVI